MEDKTGIKTSKVSKALTKVVNLVLGVLVYLTSPKEEGLTVLLMVVALILLQIALELMIEAIIKIDGKLQDRYRAKKYADGVIINDERERLWLRTLSKGTVYYLMSYLITTILVYIIGVNIISMV